MKVVREKPCQRRHHRVTAPLKIYWPGVGEMMATNWSLGGLRIDGLSIYGCQIGDLIDLQLELPFQGFDISFNAQANIVRLVEETGTVAMAFDELPERSHDLLQFFIEDLIRGQMGTVQDTICRIDIPVTPISTKPDTNSPVDVPLRRWPLQTIFMSSVYMLLGISVFGYLAFLIYSKTMWIEVKSAVVSAPLTTLNMPADGVVRAVKYSVGDRVKRGEIIARVENPAIQNQIADTRINLEDALRDERRTQEKYRIEANRMQLYSLVNTTDHQIAKARVESLRQALESADVAHIRHVKLVKRGFTTEDKLDSVLKEKLQIEARLKQAEYELERATAMEAVSDRRYFNHKEFVADLDLLALDVEEANSRVIRLNRQLSRLERTQKAMIVQAPFDGVILKIAKAENTHAARDEPLIMLQKQVPPKISAFVDQEQATQIGLSDVVKVYFPSLGKHVNAKVVGLDRNSSALDFAAAQYVWKEGNQKSALVSIELDAEQILEMPITAGLPAVVLFPKRQTNVLLNQFSQTLGLTVQEI